MAIAFVLHCQKELHSGNGRGCFDGKDVKAIVELFLNNSCKKEDIYSLTIRSKTLSDSVALILPCIAVTFPCAHFP